jgi:hypothetical protein
MSGAAPAELFLDAMDDLQVHVSSPAPVAAFEALRANSQLPADLRWANVRGVISLIADIPKCDRPRLHEAIREVERGILIARQETGRSDGPLGGAESAIPHQKIEEALREAPWNDESVVKLPDGWELRPRIGAQALSVTMSAEHGQVRLRRVLLSGLQDCVPPEVCAEALRINARVKLARLAICDANLSAEVCVAAAQLNGATLALAARAVVAVERRAHLPLRRRDLRSISTTPED